MTKIEQCALTPAEEKHWEMTRAALVWNCPAFSHIFYTLLNNAGSKHIALFTRDAKVCPIAATDGTNLILNPDTFFKYSLNNRVFACAHEIAHCIFNHCIAGWGFAKKGTINYPNGKTLPYVHEISNMAMDYVVNDMLVESNVGEFHKDWLHDPKIGTAKDSWMDVYAKLYKDMKAKGQLKEIKIPGGKVRFDNHMEPGASQGKDPGHAAQERNQTQWDTEMAAAVASARAQGKLPAGLERMFNDLLNPKVDWREHIAALFARKVGSGSFDWRKPDRRLIVRDIYAPGPSGHGAGCVVIGVDTSGSIGAAELDMFFAEMAGILEDIRPKRLVIAWCDAKVQRVDEAEDPSDLNVIRHKGAPGGGGTSFIPVFDEIEAMGLEPDALVYLTDGMGSFPQKAPKYPVIWGSIYEQSKYPFGDVVNIPKADVEG